MIKVKVKRQNENVYEIDIKGHADYDDICYVDDYKYLKLNKFYYINYLSEKTYFRNMFKYWF